MAKSFSNRTESPAQSELSIPSSEASRISPAAFNFIDKAIFEFSFFDTISPGPSSEEPDVKNCLAKACTLDSINFPETYFMQELDRVLKQSRELNFKLKSKLEILKKRKSSQDLNIDLISYQRKREMSVETKLREEVYCSCSKNCVIF